MTFVRGKALGQSYQQSITCPYDERTEWYTPAEVFERLKLEFSLDPCAPAGGLPWIPAHKFLSREDDGLLQPWQGRVWCNPPYRHGGIRPWIQRFIEHGHGIALVSARTDVSWFQEALKVVTAVCFAAGRIGFISPTRDKTLRNHARVSSAFFAFGDDCAAALEVAGFGWTTRGGIRATFIKKTAGGTE